MLEISEGHPNKITYLGGGGLDMTLCARSTNCEHEHSYEEK